MTIKGASFERQADGSVHIELPIQSVKEGVATSLCMLSAREWAQVVASVAKGGPDQNWMMQVLAIHGEATAPPMPQLLLGR